MPPVKKVIQFDITQNGKIPPYSKELEAEIIGSILNNGNLIDIASEILKPECFYLDAHQRLFKAFLSLKLTNTPIDVLNTIEQLKSSEELDLLGGPFAIVQISGKAGHGLHLEAYCRKVLSKFLQREMIRISGETMGLAYEDDTDVQDLIDTTSKNIEKLNAGIYTKEVSNMLTNAMNAKVRYDTNKNRKEGEISGITSGFKGIDNYTWGWQQTDVIILAARPSVGKSCLAGNFAIAPAKNGIGVGIFSLEMSTDQYTARILSAESGIDLEKINRGQTNEIEDRIIGETLERISKLPIYIDDTAGLSLIEFRAKARRLVNKFNVGLIIIDYVQLMTTGTDNGKKSRDLQLGEISSGIKKTAKELNVPIIELAQLSRDIEKRQGEKATPGLSDLRDSGNLEQDADLVMFLYNESGLPRIKIAKHRQGTLGTVYLKSDLKVQKFTDYKQSELPVYNAADKDKDFDEGIEPVKDEYAFT